MSPALIDAVANHDGVEQDEHGQQMIGRGWPLCAPRWRKCWYAIYVRRRHPAIARCALPTGEVAFDADAADLGGGVIGIGGRPDDVGLGDLHDCSMMFSTMWLRRRDGGPSVWSLILLALNSRVMA